LDTETDLGKTSGVYDIIARIGADATDFDGTINSAENRSKQFGQALNITMAAAAATFGLVTIQASEFESKMSNVHTLLGPQGADRIAQYKEEILDLGRELPVDIIEDLASGLYNVVSATVPPTEQMNALELSSKAAIAGVAGLTETFRLGSTIVKSYGYEYSELEGIYNIVFKTIEQGVTTMPELASAMGGAIPIATSMGVAFEEVAGIMAAMSGVTGTTSEAATQLTGMMSALLKPTSDLEDAFENLGVVSGQELIEKMGGLQGAMLALKDYTEQYGIGIGDLIGRKEALVGYFSITGELADSAAEKTKMMYEAQGSMMAAFDIKMQDFGSQLKLFRNTIQAELIDFGQKNFLPFLTNLLQTLNKYPETIGSVVSIFINFIVPLGAITAGIKAYTLATKLAKTATALWATALGPIGAIVVGAVAAIALLSETTESYAEIAKKQYDHISKEAEELTVLGKKYDELKGKKNLSAEESKTLAEYEAQLSEQLGITVEELVKYDNVSGQLIAKKIQLQKKELEQQLKKEKEAWLANTKSMELVGFQAGLVATKQIGLGGAVKTAADAIFGSLEADEEKHQKVKALEKEIAELDEVLKAYNLDLKIEKEEQNETARAADNTANALERWLESTKEVAKENINLTGASREVIDSLKDMNLETAMATEIFIDAKKPIEDVALKFESSEADVRAFTRGLESVVGAMGSFGPIGSQLVHNLSQLAMSGFNPVNVALEGFYLLIEHAPALIGDNTIQLKSFSSEFPKLAGRIDVATNAMHDFESAIIDQKAEDYERQIESLTTELEDLYVQLSLMEGRGQTSSHSYEVLTQKAEDLENQILGLTEAWEALNEALGAKSGVTSAITELEKLMEGILESYEYFGGYIDFGPLMGIIEDTIGQAVSLLGELQVEGDWDVTIPAFQDLISEIYEAFQAMSTMEMDTGFLEELLLGLGLKLEDLEAWYNQFNETEPPNFHTGGIVYAHSGLLANDELMAILQDREVVIPRDVSTQFSPAQWNSFIKSGNVQDLGGDQKEVISLLKEILGSQGQGKNVKVLVHDPGINTALEIFQDEGESWMRRRDRNLINVGIFR